jgi:hypothetical protein
MSIQEITDQLQKMARHPDFADQSELVADAWISSGVGSEAVEPILRFMEDNPQIAYGKPGALVHFVERFYRDGYEQDLIGSIRRKPTAHTVWMLNRIINGTKLPAVRQDYISELEQAKRHQPVDEAALERIHHFLDRLASETPT